MRNYQVSPTWGPNGQWQRGTEYGVTEHQIGGSTLAITHRTAQSLFVYCQRLERVEVGSMKAAISRSGREKHKKKKKTASAAIPYYARDPSPLA